MKKRLERNKIYFETLVPLVTGGIAVGVSFFALFFSFQSNSIARESMRIAEASSHSAAENIDVTKKINRPIIDVIQNSVTDKNHKDMQPQVTVINKGKPVRDLQTASFEFLRLECSQVGKRSWTIWAPISNYYQYSFATGSTVNEIAHFVPKESFQKEEQLYDEAVDKYFEHPLTAIPYFESLIVLSYETIYGERDTQYFLASPYYGGERISENKASRLTKLWKDLVHSKYDLPYFDDIDVEWIHSQCFDSKKE